MEPTTPGFASGVASKIGQGDAQVCGVVMGQKFSSTTLRPGHGRLNNLLGAVLCLAAASCATLPQDFIPIDGRAFDEKQLSTDQAICQDEIKRNLSTDNQTTIWGPTEDAITVYNHCMAERGYEPGLAPLPPPQKLSKP